MVAIGDVFYYGVVLDDKRKIFDETEAANVDKNKYINKFVKYTTPKYVEYKVKLFQVINQLQSNNGKSNTLIYFLEILEILNEDEFVNNKIGGTVTAYDTYTPSEGLVSLDVDPQFNINDGGLINCYKAFKTLLIHWEQYRKLEK
jgi:hypothetical protein